MPRTLGGDALSATIIINITPNAEQGRVEYSVSTYESDIAGINQLAEGVQKSVMAALPKCATPTLKQE